MHWSHCLFLLTATSTAGLASSLPAAPAPIRVGIDDYCPYYCKADSPQASRLAEAPGFVIEIMQHAFGSKPDEIIYKFLPYNRSQHEVANGNLDAIVITTREEAPDLIFPDIEQGRSQGCFYKKSSNPWLYSGPRSLEQVRLTLIHNYLYGEPLQGYAITAPAGKVSFISGHTSLPRIFQMIDLGRTDVTADDSLVVAHLLAKTGLDKRIESAGCYSQKLDFYVGFSPKNPRSTVYAEQLAKTTNELRASGQLAQILSRYGIADWR